MIMNVKEFFLVLGVILFILAGVLRAYYGKKFVIVTPRTLKNLKEAVEINFKNNDIIKAAAKDQKESDQMIINFLLEEKNRIAEEYHISGGEQQQEINNRIKQLNQDKDYLQQQVDNLTKQNGRFANRIRKAEKELKPKDIV